MYIYMIEQDGERSAPIVFYLVIKNKPHVEQIVRGRVSDKSSDAKEDKGDGCRTQFKLK